MAILKDEAQVIGLYEQGNSSLVLVLLTRAHGQLRVHAKGAQRWSRQGFAGGFDLLVRGEFVLYPRGGERLWILKEWEERARPRGLGESAAKFHAAVYLCELAAALTRETAGSGYDVVEQSDARGRRAAGAATPGIAEQAVLHDLLARSADALSCGAWPGAVVLAFTLGALQSAGLLGDLRHCGQCGRDLQRPAAAAWLAGAELRCATCAAAPAPDGGPGQPAGLLLSPELLGALLFVARSAKTVRLSPAAAAAVPRVLTGLVHAALEQDLRTLPAAAALVARMAAANKRAGG